MMQSNYLKSFNDFFRPALTVLFIFTVITGLIYPLLITSFAKIFFPFLADGSLIIKNRKIVGSELIGQSFKDPKYFKSRPSPTIPFPYNAMASSGSNLGPNNPILINNVKAQVEELNKMQEHISHNQANKVHNNDLLIPIDLVTTSASGLDPHISPKAAFYQASRIAKIRHLPEKAVINLIHQFIENRQFGFLGEPRINVLKLNLALDELLIKENEN